MAVHQLVGDYDYKVFASCFTCQKEYDVSRWRHGKYGVKCECGGYVISPSGNIRSKIVTLNGG